MAKKNLPVDMDKHIWEGWRVRDFIEELEPDIERMTANAEEFGFYNEGKKPHAFKTRKELREYCKNNLPYIRKHIPDVANYFINKYGTDED